MASINSWTLSGRLVRDPEIKESKTGIKYTKMTIVTDWVNPRDPSNQKEVLYTDCTLFDKEATDAVQYLRKGSTVTVIGRCKSSKWTGQDGIERIKYEIVPDKGNFMYHEKLIRGLPLEEDKQQTGAPTKQFTRAIVGTNASPQQTVEFLRKSNPTATISGWSDNQPIVEPPVDEELPF